jgi:hypothetical protein
VPLGTDQSGGFDSPVITADGISSLPSSLLTFVLRMMDLIICAGAIDCTTAFKRWNPGPLTLCDCTAPLEALTAGPVRSVGNGGTSR